MPLVKDKNKRNELRRKLYAELESNGVNIPDAVKKLRNILAMDQKKFSDFVGISLSALRRIEQNGSGLTLSTINKILQKFSLELVVKIKSSKK